MPFCAFGVYSTCYYNCISGFIGGTVAIIIAIIQLWKHPENGTLKLIMWRIQIGIGLGTYGTASKTFVSGSVSWTLLNAIGDLSAFLCITSLGCIFYYTMISIRKIKKQKTESVLPSVVLYGCVGLMLLGIFVTYVVGSVVNQRRIFCVSSTCFILGLILFPITNIIGSAQIHAEVNKAQTALNQSGVKVRQGTQDRALQRYARVLRVTLFVCLCGTGYLISTTSSYAVDDGPFLQRANDLTIGGITFLLIWTAINIYFCWKPLSAPATGSTQPSTTQKVELRPPSGLTSINPIEVSNSRSQLYIPTPTRVQSVSLADREIEESFVV